MDDSLWNYEKGFKIYRNLHKDCWSVQAYNKDKKGWRLYAHEYCLKGINAKFLVNEKARQKVIKEKRKNVHAFIWVDEYHTIDVRYTENADTLKEMGYLRGKYNPYKHDSFIEERASLPLFDCPEVYLQWSHLYFQPNLLDRYILQV